MVVIGNPNAGKTTIFNRLTGLSQKVGNYPGVTVERKNGSCIIDGEAIQLVDLPGTYSLAAHSPDEMVTVDVILGHQVGESKPDLVLEIVDASNLERNLYLLSQVLDLGLPAVVALNMTDIAEARGIRVDPAALSRRLGVDVVPVQGHTGRGIRELKKAIAERLRSLGNGAGGEAGAGMRNGSSGRLMLDATLLETVNDLQVELGPKFLTAKGRDLHPFEVLRALVDRGGYAESRLAMALGNGFQECVDTARRQMEGSTPLAALEAKGRYAWVRERIQGCIARERAVGTSWSERIDRVVTHKVFGLVIFGLMMLLVFESIFVWARPLMDLVEALFTAAGNRVGAALPEGALRSLLVDGVISGVGMVVVFLPQIVILFFFIGLLEDCGYMARAAFLMDKVMSKCGLSGKSFIPMLSGFACAVPGIMATRVIEDRRDRLATILVTPLMSCSARLPVYSIFIGTFIADRAVVPRVLGLQALTLFSLYLLGIVSAVAMAWLLRKTLLRGATAPFIMELPTYKWPSLSTVLFRLYDRARAFLLRAGTTILAMALLVWALAYFPHAGDIGRRFAAERERVQNETAPGAGREAALARLEEEEAGAYLRDSYFGRLGRAVEPVFRPLGWDWRISMAAIASFPAREVMVATLGTVYNLGGKVDQDSVALRENLRKARRPMLSTVPSTVPPPPGPPEGAVAASRSGAVLSPLAPPQGAVASPTSDFAFPPTSDLPLPTSDFALPPTSDLPLPTSDFPLGQPVFNVPVALSIMVFFALCCQCAATVAIIKRETNSWRWAVFAFAYMTVLAYGGALITYQVGMLL